MKKKVTPYSSDLVPDEVPDQITVSTAYWPVVPGSVVVDGLLFQGEPRQLVEDKTGTLKLKGSCLRVRCGRVDHEKGEITISLLHLELAEAKLPKVTYRYQSEAA